MSVDNHTPFPALAFRQFNLSGNLLGVVVARGTFKLTNGGALALDDVQRPLVMSDTYHGDPHQTPQVACTDLAPFKPGTDVTFIGASFAPDGEPASSWTCGLKLGHLEKRLRVYGPRSWRAISETAVKNKRRDNGYALAEWELTEPQPVSHVPIDWRLAFGGRIERGEVCERNPIGCGLIDEARFDEKREWPAPQIEDENKPIRNVRDRLPPAGLGPLSPFWQDRIERAGTYDQEWLQKRHPLLPRDFDFSFWQSAHPDLTSATWLNGDEFFELDHLLPSRNTLAGTLPGLKLEIGIDRGHGLAVGSMVLDGVHFDMRPGVGRVFLTWRVGFPWPERVGVPTLRLSKVLGGVA